MTHEKITWNTQLYDHNHSFVSEYGKGLVQVLAPKEGERILDVGCGTGALAEEISRSGAIVKGIDSSVDMISKAKISYPQIAFEVADAATLSTDVLYDAVFSNATLHWVTEKEKAIQQIFNCLVPGGRFIAEFGGKNNVRLLLNAVRETTLQVTGKKAYTDFWYFPSIGEYTPLLEKQGFKVISAVHYERPTVLAGPDGIKDWFRMFGELIFRSILETEKVEILEMTQEKLRPILFNDGKWEADYKRIRIVAVKEGSDLV